MANTLTVELAPFITAAINDFTQLTTSSDNFKTEIVNGMESAALAVADLANVVRGLEVVWKGVEVVAAGFKAAVLSGMQLLYPVIVKSINGWIMMIDGLIDQLNKLPKVHLDAIKLIDANGPLGGTIASQAEEARQAVIDTEDELQKLALMQMPSDQVTAYFKRIREEAQKTAEATAAVAAAHRSGGTATTGKDAATAYNFSPAIDMAAEVDAGNKRLEKAYAARQKVIEQAQSGMYQQNMQFLQNMKLAEDANWRRINIVTGSLATMTASAAQHNKAAFEVNKVASFTPTPSSPPIRAQAKPLSGVGPWARCSPRS